VCPKVGVAAHLGYLDVHLELGRVQADIPDFLEVENEASSCEDPGRRAVRQ
jgi:hypothetical protein